MSSRIAWVVTDRALDLSASLDPEPNLAPGLQRVIISFGDRAIGRAVCPTTTAVAILSSDLLRAPRQLGMLVEELDNGVAATLMLVVPSDEFASIEEEVGGLGPDSLSFSSALPYHPAGTFQSADEFPCDLIEVGRVLRPNEMRQHPASLGNEAPDMLARLLFDTGYVSDEQRAIETLLAGI
jgi:hypothetical protein